MRKKHVIRVAIFFFICLAVLTFFSRTIYRLMLPNVEVSKIGSGMLSYVNTTTDIRIRGEDSTALELPVLLSRNLTVSRVYISLNQHVQPGDDLIGFHPEDGEYALKEASLKLAQAEIAHKTWQSAYATRLSNTKTANEKTRSKSDKERLKRELDLLESGIMDMTSEDVLLSGVDTCRETVDALSALRKNGWRMKAGQGGYVEQIHVKQGDGYAGLAPLLTLCGDDSKYLVGGVWKDAPGMNVRDWVVRGRPQSASPMNAVAVEQSDGSTTVWFGRGEDTPPPDQISSLLMTADSPFYSMLVPNKALEGGKLFLLASKTGAWGKTEYSAKEANVTLSMKDDKHTVVLSGLEYQDVLITSWNKSIHDGDTVVLKSYE